MAIRVGIGGWTYEPWRGVFYPDKLPQARELDYASRHVTAIEINGTFYRTQAPATFRKWHDEVPDDFVFTLKAPRYATNRRVLAEAGESISRFVESGIDQLGRKLGPILWQFAPTKPYDPEDFEAFLALLPADASGVPLRHAIEVRHESFRDPGFIALLRKTGAGLVYAHSADYPEIADVTADFVYARLQQAEEKVATGYPAKALDRWAERAREWAAGSEPEDLPRAGAKPAAKKRRDVFVFMINGAKVRAPGAAMALLERLRS